MAQQYAYNYAIIDENCMCIDVTSTSHSNDGVENWIPIEEYNPEYLFKYYNASTGLWYEDAAFTIEWSPA